MKNLTILTILFICICVFAVDSFAQMERRAAQTDGPVELIFPTPRHINIPTTEPLSQGELYYSIMHTFGRLDSGWRNFWGIDQGANVRFSMEYGFSDSFSAIFGRSSMDRVFDLGFRYHPLRQTRSGSVPLSASLVVLGGISSADNDFLSQPMDFTERMSLSVMLPLSRRFGDSFSMLMVPAFATFAKTDPFQNLENPNAQEYAGFASGFRYKFSSHWSVTAQHIIRYGFDGEFNLDVFGLGFDWETGGHVFQLYLTNMQGIADPYILAAPAQSIFDGGLRFGFNINRSFQL